MGGNNCYELTIRLEDGSASLRARFAGFPAWVVWAVAQIYFLIGFANQFFVVLGWVVAFATKKRQVRVFPTQPPQDKAAKAKAP